MSCKNCKEKSRIKEELYNSTKYIEKFSITFVIIWSIFAIYGIYSFIKNIL